MPETSEVESLLPSQKSAEFKGVGSREQQYAAFVIAIRNFMIDLVEAYIDFVFKYIASNTCWVSASKNIYMSLNYTVKFPVTIWLVFFLVFVIYTLLAPVMIATLTWICLGKLLKRACCYLPEHDKRSRAVVRDEIASILADIPALQDFLKERLGMYTATLESIQELTFDGLYPNEQFGLQRAAEEIGFSSSSRGSGAGRQLIVRRPWTFGSVAGGCGCVLLSLALFATALSPICLLKVTLNPVFAGPEHGLLINAFVADNKISGATFYTPLLACLAVGLYTAITALEISSAEVILMYMNQDYVDSFQCSAKTTLSAHLKKINEEVRFIQNNQFATEPHHRLFHHELVLLEFDLGGGASKDDVEAYCSKQAKQNTNVHSLLQIGACGWSESKTLGMLFIFALVNTVMPYAWMEYFHPRDYLHDIGFTATWLVWTSFVACFMTTYWLLLVSWMYASNVHHHLVRKALLLFLCSPEASRRFIFNVYNDHFLKNVALYDQEDAVRGKEKSLQVLFLFSKGEKAGEKAGGSDMNYPRLPASIQLARMPGRTQLQALTQRFLTHPQISLSDTTTEELDDISEGAVVHTDLYRQVVMWLQTDALLCKTKMSVWMTFTTAGFLIVLMQTLVTVFFWKLSFTSMSFRNIYTLALIGFVMFKYFSYSLWYHRIHNEHSIALLQNWQEAIRRVQDKYIARREKALHESEKKMCISERVEYYSIFRAMLDPINVMTAQTSSQNVPITIFGFQVTEQAVVRSCLAILTAIGTGVLNILAKSQQLEDAQEWVKNYIQSE